MLGNAMDQRAAGMTRQYVASSPFTGRSALSS
jgi:hypothetical protein